MFMQVDEKVYDQYPRKDIKFKLSGYIELNGGATCKLLQIIMVRAMLMAEGIRWNF